MEFNGSDVPYVLSESECRETKVWQRTALLTFGETTVMYITATTEGEDRTEEILKTFHEPAEEEKTEGLDRAETETETEAETEGLSL